MIHVSQAKLNNDSPGKSLHHGDDKDAAENSDNGDGSNVLNDETFVQDKTPDTDSDLNHQVSQTEEYENSPLSLSGQYLSYIAFITSDQLTRSRNP